MKRMGNYKEVSRGYRAWVKTRKKNPQISPLRCGPVEKHFHGRSAELQVPRLRSGMTKERVTILWKVIARPTALFITLGGPQAHDYSGRRDNSVAAEISYFSWKRVRKIV
jgi:hypothetical protein